MTNLEFLRREKGLSQRALGAQAGVAAAYICNAEKRGLVLYSGQAERIASVLGWTGNPDDLFAEVKAHATV